MRVVQYGPRFVAFGNKPEFPRRRLLTIEDLRVGEVVSVEVTEGYSSGGPNATSTYWKHFQPTFRFVTSDGETRTGASEPHGDQIVAGTQMEVLYNPADPTGVRIAESFHVYRWNLVITLIGLLIVALGFVMVRASGRN